MISRVKSEFIAAVLLLKVHFNSKMKWPLIERMEEGQLFMSTGR